MNKYLLKIILSLGLASGAFAGSNDFFEKNSCYIFIARTPSVHVAQLVNITDHELVFIKNYNIASVKDNPIARSKAINNFIHNEDREALLDKSFLYDQAVSYSRDELTAIKLDDCIE